LNEEDGYIAKLKQSLKSSNYGGGGEAIACDGDGAVSLLATNESLVK
jgi:hypothetical protein